MENMPLIRFVKDSISFPKTPRSPNLDIKWRSYSRLKLIKVNCLENENREKWFETRVVFSCYFKNGNDFKWKMQSIKVVDFWVRSNSRPIWAHSDLWNLRYVRISACYSDLATFQCMWYFMLISVQFGFMASMKVVVDLISFLWI